VATRDATGVSDEALIGAMAAGEQDALRTFSARYGFSVTALAERILGNRADAEEIAADILWQCWTQASRFDRARGSVAAWVVTLARSRAIDRLRARRLREQVATQSEASAPVAEPAAAVHGAERRARVQSALATLKDSERDLVTMAFFADLTQSEIAARTGLPLGTVKTRIRTGLLRLRDELRRGGGDV
jgi:RNA polymerase sigma-70 factor, ECF subfamily